MKITRIFTVSDAETHMDDIEIPLSNAGEIGFLSEMIPARGVILRHTGADYDYDWHNAPQRQFVVMLKGAVDVETSDGSQRRIEQGEILLVEDTTGRGHRSRAVNNQERISLFIPLL